MFDSFYTFLFDTLNTLWWVTACVFKKSK